jgi:hypothetical protein
MLSLGAGDGMPKMEDDAGLVGVGTRKLSLSLPNSLEEAGIVGRFDCGLKGPAL